jgi:hypothetical protein
MLRDLTKSVLSFSWAMSLFGVEQLADTLLPQGPGQPTHRSTAAFNEVTRATEEQLGSVLKGIFKAGDQMQRSMVDLMFGFLTLETLNPSQMMRMTSDAMRQTTGAFGQGFARGPSTPPQGGWGPMPGSNPYAAPPPTEQGPRPASGTFERPAQGGWGP